MFEFAISALEKAYVINKVCNTVTKVCEMMLTTRGLILIIFLCMTLMLFFIYKITKVVYERKKM
jgi:hypothetical protein